MKYSLTIHDLTAEQVAEIVPGTLRVEVEPDSNQPPLPLDPAPQPPQPTRPQPVMTPGVKNSPEFDTRGMPYDERIHSGGKAINQDGSWRYRRGVDKELIKQVEGEFMASQNTTPPATGVVPPDLQLTADQITGKEPTPAIQPTMPEVPTSPKPPELTEPSVTFQQLTDMIAKAIADQWFTTDTLMTLNTKIGVTNLQDIQNDSVKITLAAEALRELDPSAES